MPIIYEYRYNLNFQVKNLHSTISFSLIYNSKFTCCYNRSHWAQNERKQTIFGKALTGAIGNVIEALVIAEAPTPDTLLLSRPNPRKSTAEKF